MFWEIGKIYNIKYLHARSDVKSLARIDSFSLLDGEIVKM